MKKQLGLITDIAPHQLPVYKIDNYYSNDDSEYVHTFNGYLIIYSRGNEPFMGKILQDQIELPLKALPWLIDAVENGFGKKPSEGGLAKDVFNMAETIYGEKLYIRWGVSVAGEGIGGYTIFNMSRDGYITGTPGQEFAIAHDMMVDQLIPLFKRILAQLP